MKTIAAFFSGLLFSVGLILSGMTQPANIVGFLDFFGSWKPALMWVMAGAVTVYAIGFRLVLKKNKPLFSAHFDLPSQSKIDSSLIFGAIFFGFGWGWSGICPGPALVVLSTLQTEAVVFFAAMVAGTLLFNVLRQPNTSASNNRDVCG